LGANFAGLQQKQACYKERMKTMHGYHTHTQKRNGALKEGKDDT